MNSSMTATKCIELKSSFAKFTRLFGSRILLVINVQLDKKIEHTTAAPINFFKFFILILC